eukprot:14640182-Ditylum_brightwellii.AAC.1
MCNSTTYCNPNKTKKVNITMVVLIDDTTGQTNIFESNDVAPEKIIEQMQHNTQLWSDLMWISGRLLELDKCSYHLVYYVFLDGGTPVMASKQQGQTLQVRQTGNIRQADIEHKNPYTPHKTLGHFKAPGGNGATQLNVLKELAHAYAIQVTTSALTHTEAKIYFNSCYYKSIGYMLGQLFFTEKEVQSIEQEATQAFTSKMGFSRNMVCVICEGPYNLGGTAVTP